MHLRQDWKEGTLQWCCALHKADVWSVVHQLQFAFSVSRQTGEQVNI